MGLGQVLTVVRDASWADRQLYGESVIALARAAADLRTRRFRDLVQGLERVDADAPPPALDAPQAAEARRVADAVRRCARNVPWEALCLCQALAMTRMLQRRGIGGQVTLGGRLENAAGPEAAVDRQGAPNPGGTVTPDAGRSLTAHAWISARQGVLLGGEKSPEVYAGLVSYQWSGR